MKKGLINGMDKNTFGYNVLQYSTSIYVLLRVLGYDQESKLNTNSTQAESLGLMKA